jgi:hypothetical protein
VDKDAKDDGKQPGKGVPPEIFGEEIDDSGQGASLNWEMPNDPHREKGKPDAQKTQSK